MSVDNELEPSELRLLRPSVYLRDRKNIDPGGSRDGQAGNFATAACLTFEDGEVSPHELLTVYEAIKQCLELADGSDPGQRLRQAVDEALEVTASLLDKKINGAIVQWIREWMPFVTSEEGITAFMNHMSSVVQQYSLVMRIKHGVS